MHAREYCALAFLMVALFLMQPVIAADSGEEFFETKVRPVFVERCYSCHSADAKKLKGALRVDSREALLKGGESETPAIAPGKPDESQLIKAVRYEEEALRMPPKQKLKAEEIAALEAWVKLGAPMPKAQVASAGAATKPHGMTIEEGKKFWSLIAPKDARPPEVKQAAWARNDVDRFVLAKLEEKKIAPSAPADRRTLIRRATFDLIGLPPTVGEIEAFEKDPSAVAYEKVIDRLLASPQYGERWGRYWLDVARYADTKGYVFQEERRFGFSYTYRDWVVRSLNDDLPYDQFLIHQIAADRLELKEDKRPLAALGFLTVGRRFLNAQPDIIDDQIDVICRGTMGLTVACARCHDHKYDPIPTADYYSLYGVLASSREPDKLPLIGDAPIGAEKAEFEKELTARKAVIDEYEVKRQAEINASLIERKTVVKSLIAGQSLLAADDSKAKSIGEKYELHPWVVQRWRDYLKQSGLGPRAFFSVWGPYDALLARKLGAKSPVNLTRAEAQLLFNGDDGNKVRELKEKVDALVATHPGSPPRAMAMEDLPAPVEPVVFVRGNAGNPGKQVPRQFLAVLSAEKREPFKQGSGRMELAKKIASKENPLTARVMVNRVWQRHFGAGLVRTPSDFGTRGEKPTHPELLDWLALRFENEDGWSLKKLHKRMMLSATYQQASVDANPVARQVDPENRLLWRMNARRLDFEAMRDSLLATSGQLDSKIGGRSIDIFAQPFSNRRTLYAFIDRQNLPGTFRMFDFASPDSHSPQRFATSVPQQALYMMNSPFVIEQAKKLAARAAMGKEEEPAKGIAKLYRSVLGRGPTKDELDLGSKFVQVEMAQSPDAVALNSSAWQYGYGEFDEATQRVKAFQKLPHFTGSNWQGGAALPDAKLGWVLLSAGGGHVGNDEKHAVIRRWVAPRDCSVAINGKLSHTSKDGNGVRARLITSREGLLGSWIVYRKEAATDVKRIAVKTGDTVDFMVDCGRDGDYNSDQFDWSVTVTKEAAVEPVAGDDTGGSWSSQSEFSGPAPKPAMPMNAWEKYAQVLLESNEFMFVD